MTAPDPQPPAAPETDASALREVLAAHQWRDVLGDYEITPFYKHFGCSCGWEQNIAGMSGWRSWVAAHHAHVAEHLATAARECVRVVEGERDALREALRIGTELDNHHNADACPYCTGGIRARAESAEAAHEATIAGVRAWCAINEIAEPPLDWAGLGEFLDRSAGGAR